MDIFKDKIVLITGGTGSLGRALTRELLRKSKAHSIRIYSRDEWKQWQMRQDFRDDRRLRFLIGDVRDSERLSRATEGVDFLVHTAALKQVPACEYNPIEAVRTNIDGAVNVINAALNNNIEKVIAVSTDKAVQPVNIYGATKFAAERAFVQSNSYRGAERPTSFAVVRYGNVLGSRGSVVPLFLEQKQTGKLTITDEQMTRFWITMPQAVSLVLRSFEIMRGGEVFIPKIPSMRLVDLARVIAPRAKFKIIGIRPGEKVHETLITQDEGRLTYDLGDRYVIFSDSLQGWRSTLSEYPTIKPAGKDFEYNSLNNSDYITSTEMKKLLKSI